jgi:hypothetical protein
MGDTRRIIVLLKAGGALDGLLFTTVAGSVDKVRTDAASYPPIVITGPVPLPEGRRYKEQANLKTC